MRTLPVALKRWIRGFEEEKALFIVIILIFFLMIIANPVYSLIYNFTCQSC